MNIVLEGPDGGGKSTLATILSTLTGMPIVPGEGPPKAPGEINERARRYLLMDGVIFDRHPCVSQPIYGKLRTKDTEAILPEILDQFYKSDILIIYCRHTQLSLGEMTVKPHEDPDHIAAVRARYAEICWQYDAWAIDRADVWYRRDHQPEKIQRIFKNHHLAGDLTTLNDLINKVVAQGYKVEFRTDPIKPPLIDAPAYVDQRLRDGVGLEFGEFKMPAMGDCIPHCKGSYALGTACGQCARCAKERAERFRKPLEADAQ